MQKKLFQAQTENIEEPSGSQIVTEQEKPKMNENVEKICNHLEFLGYQLEKTKAKKANEKDFVLARHSQKNSVFILILSPNILLFKISLTTGKKHVPVMDAFINEANKVLIFAKMYYEIDKETQEVVVRLEALYTSDYKKEAFGEFFESFNFDVNPRLYKIPNFDKLFLD